MQGKEPAACLVHTFCDEIGGIYLVAVQQFLVLERIVYLRIRHGAGVEPYVNQIRFALHGFAGFGNKDNIIYIRTVKVYLVVVFLRVHARLETFVLIRIGCHQSGSYGFLYLVIKFLYGFDTFFFVTVFRAPDRQRSTPVARTAQVPVVQVLQPLAEASRTGTFRFPVDGLVQLYHTLLAGGTADKPAIQRVVQHRFVRTPAMRIVVHVLLYLECLVGSLHHHTYIYVESLGGLSGFFVILAVDGELRVVGVLHPTSLIFFVGIYIDTLFYESFVQFVQQIELTGEVHHGTGLAALVNHEQRRNTCRTGYESIVRTECGSDVYDTRTVFRGYIIAEDYTEAFVADAPIAVIVHLYRFHPRNELFVFHSYQVRTFVFAYNLERDKFVSRLIIL